MARIKNKLWVVAVVVLLGFIVYAKLSPTFALPLGAITGGDQKNNAYAVTVTLLAGQSCSVIYHSTFGDLQQTVNPCKFGGKFATENPKLAINSVDLNGTIESRLQTTPKWERCNWPAGSDGCNRLRGFMFSDYVSDDIDWTFISYVNGVLQSGESGAAPGCPSVGTNQGGLCILSASNPFSSDYGTLYSTTSAGTQIVDKSNTFKITFSNINYEMNGNPNGISFVGNIPFTFEIINPNFYLREELARRTIPSAPHYRPVDCPVYDNYTILTKKYNSGSYVSLGGFQYPVNYFCADMPVFILDTNENQKGSSTAVLQGLIAGQTYTIPSGEVWRIDYVAKANKQLGLDCDKVNVSANFDGSCPTGGIKVGGNLCEMRPVYDVDGGGCTTKAGLIDLACDGQYIADIHACVTQPTNRCPPGSMGEYDALGQLSCYTFKAVEERLVPGAIYNVDKKRWEYLKLPQGTCLKENQTYSPSLDSCQRPRPLVPTCDAGEGEVLEVAN